MRFYFIDFIKHNLFYCCFQLSICTALGKGLSLHVLSLPIYKIPVILIFHVILSLLKQEFADICGAPETFGWTVLWQCSQSLTAPLWGSGWSGGERKKAYGRASPVEKDPTEECLVVGTSVLRNLSWGWFLEGNYPIADSNKMLNQRREHHYSEIQMAVRNIRSSYIFILHYNEDGDSKVRTNKIWAALENWVEYTKQMNLDYCVP